MLSYRCEEGGHKKSKILGGIKEISSVAILNTLKTYPHCWELAC